MVLIAYMIALLRVLNGNCFMLACEKKRCSRRHLSTSGFF